MSQLLEFIVNHWPLWLALVAILVLLVIHEANSSGLSSGFISPQEAVSFINHQNAAVVDIRNSDVFKQGHIIDAVNMTADKLAGNTQYKKKPVIVVCANGQVSSPLMTRLKKSGFDKLVTIKGGVNAWRDADLPLTK